MLLFGFCVCSNVMQQARVAGLYSLSLSASELSRAVIPSGGALLSPAVTEAQASCRLQEAKLLWAQGLMDQALLVVTSVMELLSTMPGPSTAQPSCRALLSRCSRTLGVWLVGAGGDAAILRDTVLTPLDDVMQLWQSSSASSAIEVVDELRLACGATGASRPAPVWFLHRALALTEVNATSVGKAALARPSLSDPLQMQSLKAHLALAQLADDVYATLDTRVSSVEWKEYESIRKRKREELAVLQVRSASDGSIRPGDWLPMLLLRTSLQSKYDRKRPDLVIGGLSGTDLLRHVILSERKVNEDEERSTFTVKSMKRHLVTAISHYGRYLCHASPAKDHKGTGHQVVVRIVSLWFKHSTDADVRVPLHCCCSLCCVCWACSPSSHLVWCHFLTGESSHVPHRPPRAIWAFPAVGVPDCIKAGHLAIHANRGSGVWRCPGSNGVKLQVCALVLPASPA